MFRATQILFICSALSACTSPAASFDSSEEHLVARPDGELGPSAEDVAECERRVDAIRALCGSDNPTRTCEWTAFRERCSDLDARALNAGIECLIAESNESTGCRTFSDPANAESCVESALAQYVSPAERELADAISRKVGTISTARLLSSTEVPFAAILPVDVASLATCTDRAAAEPEVEACFDDYLRSIRACEP
jgi:hypothetical protein